MESNKRVKVLLHTTSEKGHLEVLKTLLANKYDVHEASYLAEIHDQNLLNEFQIVISCVDSITKTNGIEFLSSILHMDNIIQRILLFDKSADLLQLEQAVNKAHVNYILFSPFDEEKFLKILKKATKRFKKLTRPIMNYENLVHYTQNLRENVEKYRNEATIDSLTKLMNRRAYDRFIKRIWDRYKDNNISFSIAILDLDHFKNVNDKFGHQEGDKILNKMGEIILGNLRIGVDYGFRYGGEEFAIISLDTDHNSMCLYLNRILSSIRNTVTKSDRGDIKVTFSAGVAQAGYFTSMETVLKSADKALYQAKSEGRNRIVDYHTSSS